MVELKEVKALAFLKERLQQSHLCCPGILLGLGCIVQVFISIVVCSKALSNCHNHTILITVMHYPGGKSFE